MDFIAGQGRKHIAWLAARRMYDVTNAPIFCSSSLAVCAPIDQQPKSTRSKEELKSDEIPLYEAMTGAAYIEKLCRLMSLEEKKEEDHFHSTNFLFFKVCTRCWLIMIQIDTIEPIMKICRDCSEHTVIVFCRFSKKQLKIVLNRWKRVSKDSLLNSYLD